VALGERGPHAPGGAVEITVSHTARSPEADTPYRSLEPRAGQAPVPAAATDQPLGEGRGKVADGDGVFRKVALPTGIRVRHQRACRAYRGEACSCKPSYEASVWSTRDGRKVRRTFPTVSAARSWRADALVALRKGTLRAPSTTTLRQAAEAWLDGAHVGVVRTRAGDPYKPSALRSYEASLRNRVLPELGAAKLSAITRLDLQDFADRLLAEGLDPSTVRNHLMPLRAIYRRALNRGEIALHPTAGLELPAARGRRDRVADPEEARQLIAALPPQDRAIWATALYAGLRRGELMALRWDDVDLDERRIRVARSWDAKERITVAPKSAAGVRTVPMPAELRAQLLEHRLRTGRGEGFVFGADGATPFTYSSAVRRAERAWRRAGLRKIGLHEARHTCASLMIAARIPVKALSSYMGHATIAITLDRYAHLLPGSEDEAAQLLDAYLSRGDAQPAIGSVP
jgi:integrase